MIIILFYKNYYCTTFNSVRPGYDPTLAKDNCPLGASRAIGDGAEVLVSHRTAAVITDAILRIYQVHGPENRSNSLGLYFFVMGLFCSMANNVALCTAYTVMS